MELASAEGVSSVRITCRTYRLLALQNIAEVHELPVQDGAVVCMHKSVCVAPEWVDSSELHAPDAWPGHVLIVYRTCLEVGFCMQSMP